MMCCIPNPSKLHWIRIEHLKWHQQNFKFAYIYIERRSFIVSLLGLQGESCQALLPAVLKPRRLASLVAWNPSPRP